MPTRTVEQYVKTLSETMEVTPGSATAMAKQLHEVGPITYYPRKGAELTEAGRRLAPRMFRRHRLIETFIERVDGTVEAPHFLPLSEVPHGTGFEVARIGSYDGVFLKLMKKRGIVPGARFVLSDKSETAGTISLRASETGISFTLGYDLGRKILGR